MLVDSPHERAWRETLRELMETRWSDMRGDTTYSPERFTPELYQQIVAGKPRMSGARAALDHFGVPDAETRVDAVRASASSSMVVELIEAGEFTAFPDALRFVLAVRGAGMRVAAASSSKNAGLMLGRSGWNVARRGARYGFGPDLSLLDAPRRRTSRVATSRTASRTRRSS